MYDPLTNTRQYSWLGFTTFVKERGDRSSGRRRQAIMNVATTAMQSANNLRGRQTVGRSILLAQNVLQKFI
jgi:hypothetical protein